MAYIVAPPDTGVVRATNAATVVGTGSIGRASRRTLAEVGGTISDGLLISRIHAAALNPAALLLQSPGLGDARGPEVGVDQEGLSSHLLGSAAEELELAGEDLDTPFDLFHSISGNGRFGGSKLFCHVSASVRKGGISVSLPHWQRWLRR